MSLYSLLGSLLYSSYTLMGILPIDPPRIIGLQSLYGVLAIGPPLVAGAYTFLAYRVIPYIGLTVPPRCVALRFAYGWFLYRGRIKEAAPDRC